MLCSIGFMLSRYVAQVFILFILLMSGTLTVYHCPMRPIEVKPKKRKKYYTLKIQNNKK